MKRLINLLLCLLILFSLVACKSEDKVETSQVGLNESFTNKEETSNYTYKKSDLETDKVETVYVDLDPYGNTESIEVETTLKSKLEGELKDVASLEKIVNTSGDENYEIKDGIIYFENHGEDITYKGTSNKELPVSIKLTYYLDGKEVKIEDLAHKSGRIKIEFKYTNNTSSIYSTIKVPFICISLVMLDNEKFSNITVENGKLLSMSDNKIVTLYGEPGLKDSLKLYTVDTFDGIKLNDTAYFEADVEDFTLEYTATLVSNGLFDELEDEDINDLSNSINDLSDLNSKIDDIKDATNKLKDASNELVDGVSKLNDGTSQLNDGIQKYNEGINNIGVLTQNISDLAINLDALAQSEAPSISAIKTCVSTLSTSITYLKTCLESISSLKEIINNINLSDITYGAEDNNTKDALDKLKKYDFSSVDKCLETITALDTSLSTLNETLDKIDTKTLTDSSSALKVAASTLNSNESKNALIEGMAGIASGSSSLKDGVKALNDNMPKLTDGVNEFSDKLNDAIDDSRDDINKLSGTNMKNIISNLKNIKVVDKEYDSFIGKLDGMTSSVSFIYETGEIK